MPFSDRLIGLGASVFSALCSEASIALNPLIPMVLFTLRFATARESLNKSV
jgi:hypothetical protein